MIILEESIFIQEFSWPLIELAVSFCITFVFVLVIYKDRDFSKGVTTSFVVYLLVGGLVLGVNYLSMYRVNTEIRNDNVKLISGRVEYYSRPNKLVSFKVDRASFMIQRLDAYCYSNIDLELKDRYVEIYYVELAPFIGVLKKRCILDLIIR